MKNRIITILSLVIVLGLMSSMGAYAASHGANAHSPSMSIESGDEPIADSSTTQEPSSDKKTTNTGKSSNKAEKSKSSKIKSVKIETEAATEEEIAAEEKAMSTPDSEYDESKSIVEEEKADKTDDNSQSDKETKQKSTKLWVAITIAVAVCALVAAIMLFRSRRKDKYESKH